MGPHLSVVEAEVVIDSCRLLAVTLMTLDVASREETMFRRKFIQECDLSIKYKSFMRLHWPKVNDEKAGADSLRRLAFEPAWKCALTIGQPEHHSAIRTNRLSLDYDKFRDQNSVTIVV